VDPKDESSHETEHRGIRYLRQRYKAIAKLQKTPFLEHQDDRDVKPWPCYCRGSYTAYPFLASRLLSKFRELIQAFRSGDLMVGKQGVFGHKLIGACSVVDHGRFFFSHTIRVLPNGRRPAVDVPTEEGETTKLVWSCCGVSPQVNEWLTHLTDLPTIITPGITAIRLWLRLPLLY
jgi:hypothetical protein